MLWKILCGACVLLLIPASALAGQAAAEPNSCLTCHSTLPDQNLSAPATLFRDTDVHRERGFACVDCHGGNPTTDAKARAHDKSGREAAMAFRGKPSGQAVIATCARCHSDPELMRTFAPKQRVDQAAEFATSVHGKLLATGDTKVATCASCHGAHGVRLVSDAKSPIFATNVANTCASCHADSKHMAGYTLPDGSPLPTTQLADYQASVHFEALTKKNDLSAPTCNDCHGNHGAVPPGVGSMANVCGTCHVVFQQKFEPSIHNQIFDRGCVECHGNHKVAKPTDEMLSTSGPGICTPCHTAGDKTDKGALAAETMRSGIEQLKTRIDRSRELIASVGNEGIEVTDQDLALREAGSKLTLARTELHAFDPARVDAILADGSKIVDEVDRAGENGVAELRYRRGGLAVSLGAILLVVVAIALKVRQIDQRRSGH